MKIELHKDFLVIYLKKKNKVINFPWKPNFSELLFEDNYGVVHSDGSNPLISLIENSPFFDRDFCHVFPFKYIPRIDKNEQNVFAKARIEIRVYKRKIFGITINTDVQRYCVVDFYKEPECMHRTDVGEEVNTWKGGITSCSISMYKGEDKKSAVKRMEDEGAMRLRFQ